MHDRKPEIKGTTEKSNRLLILGLLLGIIFFSSFSGKPEEQTTKYSIHILGANVGEFSVTQTSTNGNVRINAITAIKVNLPFPYRIKYVQNTEYKEGLLQNSQLETYKNGKLNSEMCLKFRDGSYLLSSDGETTIIKDSITYSGSLIYFNEPRDIKQIFKERSAEIKQITRLGEHTYIIEDVDNREINRYVYMNGILQYAKMRHSLGTFELKRLAI